jgi:hypothetical protein
MEGRDIQVVCKSWTVLRGTTHPPSLKASTPVSAPRSPSTPPRAPLIPRHNHNNHTNSSSSSSPHSLRNLHAALIILPTHPFYHRIVQRDNRTVKAHAEARLELLHHHSGIGGGGGSQR